MGSGEGVRKVVQQGATAHIVVQALVVVACLGILEVLVERVTKVLTVGDGLVYRTGLSGPPLRGLRPMNAANLGGDHWKKGDGGDGDGPSARFSGPPPGENPRRVDRGYPPLSTIN